MDPYQVSSGDSIVGGEAVELADPVSQQALSLYITNPMGGTPGVCTGSAIAQKVILTAAHCLESYAWVDVRLENTDGTTETYTATKAITYPGFNLANNRDADIGLIFLDHELPSSVQIMKLPEAGQDLQLTKILAAGFGKRSGIEADKPPSGELYKVELNVTRYSPTNLIIEVDQSQGKALCKGDSGGPGIWEHDGQSYVVGIIRGGLPTKQDPLPLEKQDRCNGRGFLVNIQIPEYINWIQEQLAGQK